MGFDPATITASIAIARAVFEFCAKANSPGSSAPDPYDRLLPELRSLFRRLRDGIGTVYTKLKDDLDQHAVSHARRRMVAAAEVLANRVTRGKRSSTSISRLCDLLEVAVNEFECTLEDHPDYQTGENTYHHALSIGKLISAHRLLGNQTEAHFFEQRLLTMVRRLVSRDVLDRQAAGWAAPGVKLKNIKPELAKADPYVLLKTLSCLRKGKSKQPGKTQVVLDRLVHLIDDNKGTAVLPLVENSAAWRDSLCELTQLAESASASQAPGNCG